MSDFLVAIAPLLGFWTLPLTPLLYAAVVGLVEAVSTPAPDQTPEPVTAAELAT